MADNPIKHDDLIQPGNPFDQAIKGLTDMIKLYDKLLKDIRKSAKEQIDALNKLSAATKQGQNETKKAATATQKLSEQEKAALSIKKSLERAQAKLNAMSSEEYKALVKVKEATRQKNAELKKSVQAMDKGHKSTNTWAKSLGSFAFKFNALGNMAAMAMQRITQGIKNAIKESFNLGLRLEGIERAYKRLNDPKLLDRLKEATKGTVSELELMQRAVVASRFDISLKRLPELLAFATQYAQDAGVEVDILTDKIVRGIGRKSVLILDDLGLTASQIRAELNGMSVEAVSVAELTDAVGRIAAKSLEQLGGVAETTAVQIASFRALLNDFKAELGSRMTGGFSSQIEYFKALDTITKDREVTNGLQRMRAFFGFMKESKTFALAQEIQDAKIDKFARDLNASAINMNNLFGVVNGFDFKTSGLWAMTMAIADMEEKAPETFDAFIDTYDEMAFSTYDIDVDLNEKRKKLEAQREKEYIEHLKVLANASNTATATELAIATATEEELTRIKKEKEDERNAIITNSLSYAAGIAQRFTSLFATQKEKELSAVGDNAKKREAIEKKYAKKEQQLAIISAIISTAQGVAGALGDFPFPYSLIPAAIVAGLGAAEIATIAGQEFAEGGSGLLDDKGGVLPGKRHSQGGVDLGAIGVAERGEYFGIVNRQMTKKYAGDLPNIFDSLNNGAFHEIWGRSNITTGDPYTKKMYELMQNTPVIIPEGKRIEKYPTGRTRIVNV